MRQTSLKDLQVSSSILLKSSLFPSLKTQKGFIGSIVTSDLLLCKGKAWVFEVSKGQKINFTLYDFSLNISQNSQINSSLRKNYMRKNSFIVNEVNFNEQRKIAKVIYKRALEKRSNLILSPQNNHDSFYSLLNKFIFSKAYLEKDHSNKTSKNNFYSFSEASKVTMFESTKLIPEKHRQKSIRSVKRYLNNCQKYLLVEDGSKNISVCGGNNTRIAWNYISETSNVKVWVTAGYASNDLRRFLLEFSGMLGLKLVPTLKS